jgi:hypothetical protein
LATSSRIRYSAPRLPDSQIAQQQQLQESVKDLPENQKEVIESHPSYSEGSRLMKGYSNALTELGDSLTTARDSIQRNLASLEAVDQAEPQALITQFRERLRIGLNERSRGT